MPKDSSIIGIMNSSKTCIVLIHGFGFDPRIWLPVDIGFDGHAVVSFALPGFGAAEPEGPYTIEQLATHYLTVLSARGYTSFHLAGHSMGGYVCAAMAAQQPDRVMSFALIHSHVFADTESKKADRTSIINEITTSGHQGFAGRMIGGMMGSIVKEKSRLLDTLTARGISFQTEAWVNGVAAMRDRSDHSETLQSLRVPVLLIGGEEDKAVPPELMYKQAALCSQCDLHMLPGTGHLSMYENTAVVIDLLLRFYGTID